MARRGRRQLAGWPIAGGGVAYPPGDFACFHQAYDSKGDAGWMQGWWLGKHMILQCLSTPFVLLWIAYAYDSIRVSGFHLCRLRADASGSAGQQVSELASQAVRTALGSPPPWGQLFRKHIVFNSLHFRSGDFGL